ncbi:very long-chain-fatty-acid--CoA ligase bubblegum isoform X3 [Cylas formicarius]|uniref:very long-chain-fatty-acid--CoA ligase bubblegum isoform X3 n=1 Tax=Cylas formicarius TaxID=197179 RepID=UPI0029589637|nr:very long-chain-fatty-acid--CoA ligase bubblegum isoform X3 [Cylas formicarius]
MCISACLCAYMHIQLFSGPDQIKPAENYTTCDPAGCVQLRIPDSGKALETIPPKSVPSFIKRIVDEFPNHPALGRKINGKWETITYTQYLNYIKTCAKAFIQVGLEPRHSVCIIGFNSIEWFVADLAAIFAGGIAVGIYTTNSPEACQHCAEVSRANIIVVEDDQQLQKILSIKANLPKLKTIVQYTGEPKHHGVLSWDKLMEIGKARSDDLLNERLSNIASNECCTLVFTSGTVGNPKAVMLSHDNLTWDAMAIAERIRPGRGCESLISYLPLSHVAAQVVDIYLVVYMGGTTYFADKNALKGSLINTLQEVQPTKFLGVPRVYEKIYEKMQEVAAQNGFIKKTIATWAKQQTLRHHLALISGENSKSWSYSIASSLIFKKVKQALGLSRCTYFCSAAAPLATDIKKYFLSIDMPIMECFGMSEASGAHTIAIESATNLNTIGMTIPGMKTKIFNPDEEGQGELLMMGRHVFMGYLNDIEKTNEVIDEEGWLHTGDLGKVDEKGFVYITGRLKEIIITSGGENVPPVPIEQHVKKELPALSNVFLVGDKRKFLSLLVTLKTEVDSETGAPNDSLIHSVQSWLQGLGVAAKTVTEVLETGPDQRILDALQAGIDRVNKKATSNAQRIQKVAILPADFSLATGELGPTMKVKRRVVEQKYKEIIDKMYAA